MNTQSAEPSASSPRGSWWESAVMYEVYPRSFADGNGDGGGDLAGLAARLPYIAALGVDGIWMTPFQPSPQVDQGYDVSDYCGVDPLFGTMAEFDRLLETALKCTRRSMWARGGVTRDGARVPLPWTADAASNYGYASAARSS